MLKVLHVLLQSAYIVYAPHRLRPAKHSEWTITWITEGINDKQPGLEENPVFTRVQSFPGEFQYYAFQWSNNADVRVAIDRKLWHETEPEGTAMWEFEEFKFVDGRNHVWNYGKGGNAQGKIQIQLVGSPVSGDSPLTSWYLQSEQSWKQWGIGVVCVLMTAFISVRLMQWGSSYFYFLSGESARASQAPKEGAQENTQ